MTYPKTPEYRKHFQSFTEDLYARLDQGHKEYGDASFTRSIPDLINEIDQELMDIVGWAFIMRVRLNYIKQLGDVLDKEIASEPIPIFCKNPSCTKKHNHDGPCMINPL